VEANIASGTGTTSHLHRFVCQIQKSYRWLLGGNKIISTQLLVMSARAGGTIAGNGLQEVGCYLLICHPHHHVERANA
jgi:hypothetical protein